MSARSTSSTRGSAREGGGGGAPSSANSNNASVYERMVELEKELRIRDSHLDQLTHEKKALEKVSKNKETSLITLTNELIEAKKHISKLELDVATKNEESKQLFEKKSAYTQQLLNAETISALQEENKTIHRLIKQREDEFLQLHEQIKEHKTKLIYALDPIIAENRSKELMQTIVELQEENRMLLSIQKAKTQAIEDLTNEVNDRGASDQLLAQMETELKGRKKEIAKKDEDIERLTKEVKKLEEVTNKYRSEEVGVPIQMWKADRDLMVADLVKNRELVAQMDKTIKSQKERITQLQENLDVIMKSYDGGKSPSAALRTFRRSKTFSSSSLNNTLNSDSSPISTLHSANNTTTENGNVDFDGSSVPIRLYEVLEKNVQRMSVSLGAKETLLTEKDEALEVLERKLDVLNKARATDSKRAKKTEVELRDEVQLLREKLVSVEGEAKERVQQLTLELTKLKRRPIVYVQYLPHRPKSPLH